MQTLFAAPLVLEPLTVAHTQAMFEVLNDPEIYHYLDYLPPPSVEHLRNVYASLEAQKWKSPDGKQQWLNWVVREPGQAPVGYVQATIGQSGKASIGFVLASKHWGRGYAHTATHTMLEHLATAYGVSRCQATVEIDNQRSVHLLERLAFRPATARELADHTLTATERLFVR